MSKLFLANNMANWQLNVVSFSSPLFGMLTSVQTKKMAHHYPIKCSQPEIQFTVQFSNEKDFEDFQRFVRAHQQNVMTVRRPPMIWLNWPERDINNWTGVIRSVRAGGMRANFAPRMQFVVDLVDSMLSHRTELASIGTPWQAIYGEGMGADSVLGLPSAAEEALAQSLHDSLFGAANRLFSPGFSNGATQVPSAVTVPGVGSGVGSGILPGG